MSIQNQDDDQKRQQQAAKDGGLILSVIERISAVATHPVTAVFVI